MLKIACKQVSQTAHDLHLCIFEQLVEKDFCNIPMEHVSKYYNQRYTTVRSP